MVLTPMGSDFTIVGRTAPEGWPPNAEEMPMRQLHIVWIALTAVALAALPALAHHGWSSYDSSKEMTVDGVIKESGYEHPHGHISLEVPGRTWTVTLAPPSRMQNRGLPSSMLVPGTKARVVGYPSRNEPNEMRAERITVNGKTVELR